MRAMSDECAAAFGVARTQLITMFPFFGSVALKLRAWAADQKHPEPTLAVGPDFTVVVNEGFFLNKLTKSERVFVIAHEAMHIVLDHMGLASKFAAPYGNMAADYALNPALVEAGLKAPKGTLIDSYWGGHNRTAEQIAENLIRNNAKHWHDQGCTKKTCAQKKAQSEAQQQVPDPSGDGEQPAVQSPGQGDHSKAGDGQGDGDGQGQGQGDGDPCGTGGSCGSLRPELYSTEKGRDAYNGSPDAAKELADDHKQVLMEAATTAKLQGKLPAGLESLIEQAVERKVTLKQALSKFVGTHGPRTRRNALRPSRRSSATGVHLASRKRGTAELICLVDTSGSISTQEYDHFLGTLNGVCEDMRTEVTVIECDAKVQAVHTNVVAASDLKSRHGWGGSDFNPAFEWIRKNRPEFRGVIVGFTDGYIDIPRRIPERVQDVLWVMTRHSTELPWGQHHNMAGETQRRRSL